MLYMMINTHNPESCAFRSDEDAQALVGPTNQFEELAPKHGMQVLGTWVNRPGHELFVLIDAPSPHTIDELIVEVGLIGRSHTRIVSVMPTGDVTASFGDLASAASQ